MYLINHDGEELEPMSREQVQSLLESQELSREDWVWDELTEAWAPIHELLPEFFPTFGAPILEDLNDGEKPTEAIPPVDPMSIEHFIQQGQRKNIVKAIIEMLRELLEPGERLLQIATQRKPMPDLAPEAFALTNERMFVFTKGHFRTTYEEMPILTILHPEMHKGLFFSHISFNAGAGIPYGIKFIPKKQGTVFFERLEGELHRVREAHRHAIGNEEHKAEGIAITPLTPASQLPTENHPPETEADTQVAAVHTEEDEHKALHHLEDLKTMLDEGLITEEDYERKKQAILENEL